MKKAIKVVENCILIFLIILLCIYGGLRFFKKVEIYKVETGSMEENIHRGDYLLIVKQSNYKVGDVVTFQINGEFITHRIIKKEGSKVVTKGDANNVEDDEIDEKAVSGLTEEGSLIKGEIKELLLLLSLLFVKLLI